MTSTDLIRDMQRAGWQLDHVNGSHHIFKHPSRPRHVVVPHPKKGPGAGLGQSHPAAGQYLKGLSMRYPITIESGNDSTAWGVVVPDLPGCFSAGDTLEEAMIQAE